MPIPEHKNERLEFINQVIDIVDLNALEDAISMEINPSIYYYKCKINFFSAAVVFARKKISLIDCEIQRIRCDGVIFLGGFEMTNCVIKSKSSLASGGHNANPNKFIIDNCTFEDFIDFFDVMYDGPVHIINNNFKKGTNIGIYLKVPYGIKEGMTCEIKNNIGELELDSRL